MLRIDPVHRNVVITKIFVGHIHHILLGELLHTIDFCDVIIPVGAFDERLAHHRDTGRVEFQAGFFVLKKIIDDGRNNPFFEISGFDDFNLLQQQLLNFFKGLILLGYAEQALRAVIVQEHGG